MNTKDVYLSLGSNIGNKFYHLISAIIKLDELENSEVDKISNFYTTEPIGEVIQADFINCALKLKTSIPPYDLLKKINAIEADLKRERLIKWGPRTIDIDIIFYGDVKLDDPKLTIPHKEYQNRNFVLVPLMDIVENETLVKPYLSSAEGDLIKYKYDKPILVSSCLIGKELRYDGKSNKANILDKLNLKLFDICPEVDAGLDTPRDPAEINNKKVITKNGEDLTSDFNHGAQLSLNKAKNLGVEIAILKSKSPSCGYSLIYDGSFSNKLIEGDGITAKLLADNNIKIISI